MIKTEYCLQLLVSYIVCDKKHNSILKVTVYWHRQTSNLSVKSVRNYNYLKSLL